MFEYDWIVFNGTNIDVNLNVEVTSCVFAIIILKFICLQSLPFLCDGICSVKNFDEMFQEFRFNLRSSGNTNGNGEQSGFPQHSPAITNTLDLIEWKVIECV